jgi:DNA-directed RNA polymerase subunit RPC12/RpoP
VQAQTLFILAFTALMLALLVRRLWIDHEEKQELTKHSCPECGYDLRASESRCPECGREFLKDDDGEPYHPRPFPGEVLEENPAGQDPKQPIRVFQTSNWMSADAAKQALSSEGIETYIEGQALVGAARYGSAPMSLIVPLGDAGRARTILRAFIGQSKEPSPCPPLKKN